MKQGKLIRRAVSAALAGCMMFTLSAPALAESTDALMQLSTGSYRSSSLLSEENSFPTTIKVNGKPVTEANISSILGSENTGKLSYDGVTNTLKSNGRIKGDLTIDARGVNIELCNSTSGEAAVSGKLTVTNAQDVKVTAQSYVAVLGDVEISCDGKVEITSEESPTVAGDVTVKQASTVAISGESYGYHIVRGDVTIACPATVVIRNYGTGGMASSIVYSGTSYKYYTEESGTAHDPATDPIKKHLDSSYLRITPVTARAITVTNGTSKVGGADASTAYADQTVTVTPDDRTAAGYQFVRWEVVSGIADTELIRSITDNTATFTMPDEDVKLWARYNKLFTVTTNDAKADVTTGIPGTEVTVTANVPAGEKFTGWKVECSDPDFKYDESGETVTFKMPKANVTVTAEHKTKRSVTVNNKPAASGLIEGESVTVHAADSGVSVDKFDHWESNVLKLSDADRTNPRLTFTMPDSDVVLRAVEKETYEVVVNNGKANGSSTVDAKPGEEVTITAKDDTEDEVFVGWKVDSGNVTLKDSKKSTTSFIMPHEAVELTAQHETRFTVTVNYQTDGGAATTEDASQRQRAIFGTPITVKAADRTSEGLEFDHWEITNGIALKDNEAEEITFDMVRSNVTVTAIYKTLNTISVHDGKAEVKGKEVNKAKEGDEVTITAKERLDEMKRFDHWTVRDNNVTLANEDDAATTFVMGKEAVDLTAEYVDLFKLDVINGSATLTYKGTTYAADGTAAEGDVIKATADPVKDNEHFTGWTSNVILTKGGIELTEDELKNTEITFDMPKGDVELKANYSYVHDQTVKVVNGTAHTGDTPESEEIIATPGETVYIEPADRWEENQIFTKWQITSGKGVNLDYADDGTVSFIMPQSGVPVEITAQYAKLNAVTINDGDVIDADGHGINNMNDGKPGAIAGTNITIKAKDKSAEGKVFDYWEVTSNNVSLNDDGSFEMPDEAVVITARYANVHDVTVHSDDLSYSKTFEDIKVGTPYKVTAPEIANKRFDHWHDNNGNVSDLDVKAGTFTMPDYDVDLTAVYVDLNDVTVKYGTAVNKTVETETTTDGDGRIVLPAADGDKVTVTADEPTMETFEGWTLISGTIHDDSGAPLPMDDEGYILNADGKRLTELSFAFVMCDSAVELKANYSMPAYVMPQWVTVEGGTAFAEGEAAAAEISADPGKRITVIADPNADSNMIFDYWEVTSLDEDGKATVKLEDATSMTTSFTMPMAPVELTAHWRTIDEAPSSGGAGGAGAAIAGVAIGGAAVWGGYEIATRVILNDLLPEGAAIPANRGQLALLIWTEKGKPEPAAQPAFADITDAELAKAAQWCVEQGLLDAREGKFESDGWMPKFKTIEIWNKAFPKK